MRMTRLELPFGPSHLSVEVPTPRLMGVFGPRQEGGAGDESAILRSALDNPVGSRRLRDIAAPGLPPLLDGAGHGLPSAPDPLVGFDALLEVGLVLYGVAEVEVMLVPVLQHVCRIEAVGLEQRPLGLDLALGHAAVQVCADVVGSGGGALSA